jgi:hypothetical protein
MKKHLAIAASAFALATFPAMADTHGDADHDFPLTQAEFMMEYPEVTQDEFLQIDTNADGEVSEEEYEAAREAGIIGDD